MDGRRGQPIGGTATGSIIISARRSGQPVIPFPFSPAKAGRHGRGSQQKDLPKRFTEVTRHLGGRRPRPAAVDRQLDEIGATWHAERVGRELEELK